MTQTATALSTGQALQINNTPFFTVNKPAGDPSLEWFRLLKDDHAFYTPQSVFSYGEKVKISFGLKETYTRYFVLIKGLLEFHRSKDYAFTYNKTEQSFDVSINIELLNDLNQFIRKISSWADQEIKFKSKLKQVIAFEQLYKSKMAEVYNWD